VREALGVGMQFALVDQAILVHVHELDRVFDGENVIVALAVDLVDHGGEGGRFARSGRSSYEYKTAWLIAKLADHGSQAELVEGFNLKGNETEDGRGSAALVENVGAEASQSLQAEGEVEFEAFF